MRLELMVMCPFCGQLVAVETETEPDESERTLWAKRCCRCDGAKDWRMAQEAYEKIERIVGEGAVEAGFDFAEAPETVEALKSAADDLIARRYRKVQVTTPGGGRRQADGRTGRSEGKAREQKTACNIGGMNPWENGWTSGNGCPRRRIATGAAA